MPCLWDDMTKGAPVHSGAFSYAAGDAPALRLTLWPHRSLPRKGFALFILITFGMLMFPLFGLLGTTALWGMLPFLLGTLALTWKLLERNYADAKLTEVLSLWQDRVELTHSAPGKPVLSWTANPHWVRVEIHPKGRPVENYLTLKGGARDAEIAAFLSPQERKVLYGEICDALARTRNTHAT